MFTSQATIERRAAKEARLQSIETRLASMEKTSQTFSAFESRLTTLEVNQQPKDDTTSLLHDIQDVKTELTKLKEVYEQSQQKQTAQQEKLDELQKTYDTITSEMAELRKQLALKTSATQTKAPGVMFQIPKKPTE